MIVVDASAMAELLLRTPLGLRVAERVSRAKETLHVPHLLDVEVAHALRRMALQGSLSGQRGQNALDDLSKLALHRLSHTEIISRVWDLRSSLTAYDAAYAALAESLDARILTTDARFLRAHGYDAEIELIDAL